MQAGTGTGKSLGYLVPALHHAGASTKPIVVATATLALQAQIVKRDLPKLMEALSSEPESETQVAILKGRNNYLCLHEEMPLKVESLRNMGCHPTLPEAFLPARFFNHMIEQI